MNKIHKKLGEVLKLERDRKQISFEDMASSLKMSQDNLSSLENGQADDFPSELYFSLFARSYSEALGIDYERTVEAIEDDLNQESAPASDFTSSIKDSKRAAGDEPGDHSSQEKESISNLTKLGYILGGIVALFLIFVGVRYLVPGRSGPSENTAGGREESKIVEEARLSDYRDYDWNVPKYTKPAKMVLNLAARTECWATILADGDTAIFRNLIPGRAYVVEAEYRMRVSVAKPSAVETKLNGQPVNLINTPGRRISKAWITQANLDSILAAPLAVAEPRKSEPAKRPSTNKQPAPEKPVVVTDTSSTADDNTSPKERSTSDEL